MNIHVLLKNKIIAADAIAPIAVELKSRHPAVRFHFIFPSAKAHEMCQRNIALYETLSELGKISAFGTLKPGRGSKLISRVKSAARLARLFLVTFMPNTRIVHFGALERLPFSVLFPLRAKRVVLVDSAFHGFTSGMRALAALKADRGEVPPPKAMGGAVVFHEQSFVRAGALELNVPIYTLAGIHNYPSWTNWLEARRERWLSRDLRKVVADSSYALFVLGWLGKIDFIDPDRCVGDLLRETLLAIKEAQPGLNVILKPHVITDMAQLDTILREVDHSRFVVSDVHPSILFDRARFVISNYYSTVQSSARDAGLVTVEYTAQSAAARAVNGGGSSRPDAISHFIDRDPAALVSVIGQLCSTEQPKRLDRAACVYDDALFEFLSG